MSDRLIHIDLSRSTVTDRQVESLVVGSTALETVILADCPNITNASMRHLALCLQKTLRRVNVSRNKQLDFEGLAWFGASRGSMALKCKVHTALCAPHQAA